MNIDPVRQKNVAAEAAQAVTKQEKVSALVPQTKKQDDVILSETAKDMSAKLLGKRASEEAKESAVAKSQEAQGATVANLR
jgi:predicted site-specific integrase-resolvase